MLGAVRSLPIVARLLATMLAGAVSLDPSRAADGHQAAAALPAAVAVSVRVAETAGATRLVFDLSAPVSVATAFTADPDRLVVDLPDVNFQIDPGAGRLDGRGVGIVKAFRFGTVAPGRSKIVVDLAAPAALRKAEVVSIAGGAPSRLTIDLVRADPTAFRAAATGDPADASQEPVVASPAPGDGRPVIVLDPGHGGIDPGAGGATGTVEKDVVMTFAQSLADKLAASGRYRIVLTRHDDSFVSLGDRVRIAREAGAALMISIHADMLSDASVSGATIYTASDQASDAEAGRLAAAENRADEAAGVSSVASNPDVSGILFDLARRETRTYAHQFQHNLTGYWAKIARLNRNPERSAGFRVLQAADVPSVLLELGYLSSEKDRAAMTSPAWRDKATGSVAAAVDTFFAARAPAPQTAAGTEPTVVR